MTSNALALAQKVSTLVSDSGASTTTYANTTDLPTSEVTTGAMAYVSANNKLYMWNGTAWFNIAIVNQAPTAITGNQATYDLATNGTPTIVTLVSTDPEGFPLTWSSSTSGDTQVGAVTNTDNVFTITPSTDENNAGVLSVTFSVTDGTNTETSVSSFTLQFVSAYWNETVLSIGTSSTNGLANSTFIDRSTNAHTVTPAGTPVQTAFHPYLENWSVEFDGNDYFTLSSFPKDTFAGLTNYTLECWVYQSAAQTGDGGALIDCRGNSASTGWQLRINTDNTLIFYYTTGSSIASTQTIINNQWNHIAVVKTGSSVTLYVNGIGATNASWSATYVNSASPLRIGGDAATTYLIGNISNLRIVDNDTIYTANFTPPTEKLTAVAGTSLLTCQSNRFIDNSTNAYTITVNGNPKVSAFNPFGQASEYAAGENKGSTYFDGSGDYLSVAANTDFDFGTGDFTVEAWVYPISNGQYYPTFLSSVTGWSAGASGHRFNNIGYANKFWFGLNGSGGVASGDPFMASNNTFAFNSWHHYSITRSGDTFRMFVNGVLENTQTFSGSYNAGLGGLRSGWSTWDGAQGHFTGYVSNLRLVKGTAVYTTNFTSPTAPVGNANASLYLPMDNAGIFDKTGNNTLTPVGNASTSTTQTKYADTAMYFDGSGDYISDPGTNGAYAFGTGAFTVEFWLYATNITTRQGMYSNNTSATGTGPVFAIRGSSTTGVLGMGRVGQADVVQTGSNAISQNTWHHIVLVREGTGTNQTKIYIDGTLQASGTYSDNLNVPREMNIGRTFHYNENFNGYIENFQILKGVAKYTANFTPPNRTQGLAYQEES